MKRRRSAARARRSTKDGSATWTYYHALSTDVCDPNDTDPSSPHYQTRTTKRVDGHGRVIDQVQRNREPGMPGVEIYRLLTRYRADDAVVQLARTETSRCTSCTRKSELMVWAGCVRDPVPKR